MPTFPTADAVLRAARSTVGTTEKPAGTNRTPFGKAYGLDGYAWCGMWVWWCFREAGVDLRRAGIRNPAYTPTFFQDALKAGWKLVPDGDVRPGDVIFFDFAEPFNTHGIQHVGIATARPRAGRVATIEGNTSSGRRGSQDNGDGVYARERGVDVIVAALRPPYALAKAAPRTGRAKAARVGAGTAAVAGAAAVVQAAVGHGPGQPVVPAPRTTPTTAPSATTRPPVPIHVVPAPRNPAPTAVPRPPRRARPAGTIHRVLRYGMRSDDVRALQRRLGITPTGYFGRVTLRAVLAAQGGAHLRRDGLVGRDTCRALGLAWAPRGTR